MNGEIVKFPTERAVNVARGHAGLKTQVPGGMTTVSCVARHTGDVGTSNLIQRETK